MKRRMPLVLVAAVAATVLLPAGVGAESTYVSFPPVLDPAPPDALYVAQQFTPVRTVTGAVYGGNENSQGEWVDLVLDVWEPLELSSEEFRPAIVWASGNFSANLGTGRMHWMPLLVERGYVVASIEYRVRPEWPGAGQGVLGIADGLAEGRLTPLEVVEMSMAMSRDAQHDMQAAVRWMRANAADLRIDPNWISVGGYSAGGAITGRTVFNSGDPGDSGNPDWPSHVAAGVIGGSSFAPVVAGDVVRPGEPPTVWFHGAQDLEVPVALSLLPCANVLAMGNTCEYHLWPEYGHGMSALWPEKARETADFLWRHVVTADRVRTTFTGSTVHALGDAARVTGRLTTADGRPLTDARVLGRATAGWAETFTDADGWFSLSVDAPDHGRDTDVLLRYEGHSTGSWLDGPALAPTATTVTAVWGQPTAAR